MNIDEKIKNGEIRSATEALTLTQLEVRSNELKKRSKVDLAYEIIELEVRCQRAEELLKKLSVALNETDEERLKMELKSESNRMFMIALTDALVLHLETENKVEFEEEAVKDIYKEKDVKVSKDEGGILSIEVFKRPESENTESKKDIVE